MGPAPTAARWKLSFACRLSVGQVHRIGPLGAPRQRDTCAPARNRRGRIVQSASYFREKAEQCRRLAACIPRRDDPTAASLNALGIEFDATATAIDARTAAAQAIGYGGSVPPEAYRPQ